MSVSGLHQPGSPPSHSGRSTLCTYRPFNQDTFLIEPVLDLRMRIRGAVRTAMTFRTHVCDCTDLHRPPYSGRGGLRTNPGKPRIRFSRRHIRSSCQTESRISSSWVWRSSGVLSAVRVPEPGSWSSSMLSGPTVPERQAKGRIHGSRRAATRLHNEGLVDLFNSESPSLWT